ncbi:PHP domain protein [Gemmatirosa kalamazoonensis]|uniref:DNA-directed DNA polymerase n=1 Tax=Gemmatirosa kalamazoonensis TaxID=861299 RepID=W0RGS4_9BACT|nr:DNA polymerase/3'-5' exonuclease PolX [Gemmatirosa kalamazoonensis]AHG89981.1 PHP domain protein [Gemmatirosa kalamazoonensis]
MDPRSAAHVLTRIAALLELNGVNRFKSRAYATAARSVLALDTDDIGPLLRAGELETLPGLGPATLAVLRDLVATGDSSLLEQLQEDTPEGLLEMLRVPGLGTTKIHAIHEGLGVETLHDLELAARDGRLAGLRGFGPKTAEKIAKGIAFLKANGALVLYPHAAAEAGRLLEDVRRHPEVVEAAVAGSVRRRREVICDVDVVAAVRGKPAAVAQSFGRAPGVRDVLGAGGGSARLRYVDGTQLDVHCVVPEQFAVALWRATGTAEHVAEVAARLAARGCRLDGDAITDARGRVVPVPDEPALYALAGLAFVAPELREGRGEVEAAAMGALPCLVSPNDVRGVLHCHSDYSDGNTTIAEMAAAARARGWSYLGITDHSQSAFYAGGLTRDAVLRQHDEIDALNESLGAEGAAFRVLKGIEADILEDGRVDFGGDLLERFDYVIGSVHSRFGMSESAMTERVCRALDDPHLTILGHPTGRLLLTREPYAIDMEAVIDKAAETGVAIELNADPHRLDLDWRLCKRAKERGVLVEIGPDAHSAHGLDNVEIGVGVARKGWLEPNDILNTRTADDVLAFARARREAHR